MKQTSVWRVAIFNQIYLTKYYHIRLYVLNPATGKFRPSRVVYGRRGHGGHLGMSYGEAICKATQYNVELGWKKDTKKKPPFVVYC